MHVLNSGVETVSGCGWRWEAVSQVTRSGILQGIIIDSKDVFKRIIFRQKINMTTMYGHI